MRIEKKWKCECSMIAVLVVRTYLTLLIAEQKNCTQERLNLTLHVQEY